MREALRKYYLMLWSVSLGVVPICFYSGTNSCSSKEVGENQSITRVKGSGLRIFWLGNLSVSCSQAYLLAVIGLSSRVFLVIYIINI
jgi:hypothetical protein